MRRLALVVFVPFLLAGLAAAPAPTPTPTPELILAPPYDGEWRAAIIHRDIPPDIVYPPRDMSDWRRLQEFFVLVDGPSWIHPDKLRSHQWTARLFSGIYRDCLFGLIHGVQDSESFLICGRFLLEMARRQGVRTSVVEDPSIPEEIRLWRIPRGGRVRIEMPSRFIPEIPRWSEGPSGWDYLNAIPSRVGVSFYYIGTAEVRFPDPREVPGGRSQFCPPPPNLGPVPAGRNIQMILDDARIPRAEQERLKETWWVRVLAERGVVFIYGTDYRLPADWREGEEPWWIATEPEWIGCPYYELVAPPDQDALVYALSLSINTRFFGYYATRFDPRLVFTPMPTLVAPTPKVRAPEPPPWEKASGPRTPTSPATPTARRVSASGWLRVLVTTALATAGLAGLGGLLLRWHLGRRGGGR